MEKQLKYTVLGLDQLEKLVAYAKASGHKYPCLVLEFRASGKKFPKQLTLETVDNKAGEGVIEAWKLRADGSVWSSTEAV